MSSTDNFIKHTSGNPLKRFLINNFHRTIVSAVKQLNVDAILEVGCGEGFILSAVRDSGIKASLEGIEIDPKAISICRKLHPDLKINQGDVFHLQFPEDSFDLVICCEVLEHLEHPQKALAELTRTSKKYCLLSVPEEPFFMAAGYLRFKTPRSIGHINFWTKNSFVRFVEKELLVNAVYNPFPWTVVLAQKK